MLEQLSRFRTELYNVLPNRADAVLNLLDSLSSTTTATSVVELSLSEFFRRRHSSVYDAVEHFFVPPASETATTERLNFQADLLRLRASYLPKPTQRKFSLFGVDSVPFPRLYAKTLEDRSFVHQPTMIRGNKPITIGHQYSFLVALPEPAPGDYRHWVVPLSAQRIASSQKSTAVAQTQVHLLLGQAGLDLQDQLCVVLGDATYSAADYLFALAQHDNLVVIARLRSNRKLYRPASSRTKKKKSPGRRQWYGKTVRMNDERIWRKSDETITMPWTTARGKTHTVTISVITDLRMRGKKKMPMHDKPLKAVRIEVMDAEGKPVFKKPLHLVVAGKRQQELTLAEIYNAFKERFNLEHFFRFGKQRLLLASAQTPIVDTEENWCELAGLAYLQLYLARQAAQQIRNPWERAMKTDEQPKKAAKSPSTTQRDFARIIRRIGTPAQLPKTRNKSNGRAHGASNRSRACDWKSSKRLKTDSSTRQISPSLVFFSQQSTLLRGEFCLNSKRLSNFNL